MNETALALIFTLSSIGISETVYLIRTRKAAEKPLCVIGEGCQVVLDSKYNKTFFIHNDIAGFIFYLTASAVAGLLVIGTPLDPFLTLLFVWMVAAGSIMSVYFTYLQAKVIKQWCFWCVMSAITIWTMEIILITGSIT